MQYCGRSVILGNASQKKKRGAQQQLVGYSAINILASSSRASMSEQSWTEQQEIMTTLGNRAQKARRHFQGLDQLMMGSRQLQTDFFSGAQSPRFCGKLKSDCYV